MDFVSISYIAGMADYFDNQLINERFKGRSRQWP